MTQVMKGEIGELVETRNLDLVFLKAGLFPYHSAYLPHTTSARKQHFSNAFVK